MLPFLELASVAPAKYYLRARFPLSVLGSHQNLSSHRSSFLFRLLPLRLSFKPELLTHKEKRICDLPQRYFNLDMSFAQVFLAGKVCEEFVTFRRASSPLRLDSVTLPADRLLFECVPTYPIRISTFFHRPAYQNFFHGVCGLRISFRLAHITMLDSHL